MNSSLGVTIEDTCLGDFETKPVQWLWYPWLPFGKLALLDGNPGVMKSHLTIALAAAGSGGPLLPGMDPVEPFTTVILSAEDDPADTMRPRLEAAGGDVRRVRILSSVHDVEGNRRIVSLSQDLELLAGVIREHQARLIIFDPLTVYLGSETDAHRDQDVRRTIAPLAELLQETGAAGLGIRHLRKSGGSGNAVMAGGGSIAFIGAARSGLLLARDPDEPKDGRILAQVKNNLGPEAASLKFRFAETPNGRCRIEWLGTSQHRADQLVDTAANSEQSETDEAKELLAEWLSDGPVPKTELVIRAKKAGISIRTLERAKVALGVQHKRQGFGQGSAVHWSRPILAILAKPPLSQNCGEYGVSEEREVVVVDDDRHTRQPSNGNGEYRHTRQARTLGSMGEYAGADDFLARLDAEVRGGKAAGA